MSLRRCIMFAVVLTVSAPQTMRGQRPGDATLGVRVRLETASGRRVTGTVVGVDADSIRVVTHSTAPGIAVPRATIIGYEVSVGREHARGAKRGALAGGALGLAVMAASLNRDTATVDRQPADLRRAVAFGASLVAAGAAIGATFAPERWESVGGVVARARMRASLCPGRCMALGYRF
jgi:hypothetical protein